MGLPGYSHDSIIRWANDTFSSDFHQFPGARDIDLQLHNIRGFGLNGCLKGFVVGSEKDNMGKRIDILAWLEGGDVEVGYVKQHGKNLKVIRYEIEEEVVELMEGFVKPFCWISREDTDTALARFAALVRYYLLAKGTNTAVKQDMGGFGEHFPAACRDVAAAQDVEASGTETELEEKEMTESTVSSLPPSFRYDFEVLVDSMCGTSSTPLPSTPYTHAPTPSHDTDLEIDTNTTAATTSLEEQRAEITSLRNKIQLLDHKLMVAEGRAQKAEDEAANWQVHYEQEVEARRNAVGAEAGTEDQRDEAMET